MKKIFVISILFIFLFIYIGQAEAIDDVYCDWASIFNKSGEINSNDSSLKVLYHLNNNASLENSTFVYDYSGNGYNAVCSSPDCPTFVNDGKIFGAANFTSNDTLNITTSTNLNLSNNFTVSLWVKMNSIAKRGGIIRDLGLVNNYENGWKVVYDNVLNKFAFRQSCQGVSYQGYSDVIVDKNKWYHIALKFENGLSKFFINGVLQSANSTLAVCDNPYTITLGYDFFDSTGDIYLNGTMDEIGIWQRPLSNSEIEDLYKLGYGKANLQVRSCNDNNCSGETFSQNFTESPIILSSVVPNNTYFQYKVLIDTENRSITPEIQSVLIENYANESEARTAILQGIQDALVSGYSLNYDYQIYSRNISNYQALGKFDLVANKTNKTYAFNYVTSGESLTNMKSITPTLNVLELSNKAEESIRSQVNSFIQNN